MTIVLAAASLAVASQPAQASTVPRAGHDLSHPMVMSAFSDLAAQPASPALTAQSPAAYPRTALLAPNPNLRREVLGFVNAGNLGSSSVGYTTWNFSLLSTVVFFALQVNSGDGNLVQNNTGWAVFHSSTMAGLVSTAHANGTKVIVSLNLHDFSTDPNNQTCQGLASASAQNTISQVVAQVNAAGIDGVNVDYEGTNTTCADGLTSRSEMTSFVQNLRAAMPNGYIVVDTYTGSAEDNLEFFDVTGLAPYLDSFFVMAYDMDFSNYSEVPLSCTSYCFNPTSPLNTYRFNVTKSMTQYTALVPASKVILGQPYYGRKACVAQPDVAHQYLDLHQYPAAPPNFVSPTYLDAISTASDPATTNYHVHRDPGDGVSEWDTFWSSDFGCWREQDWNDTVSLGAKYDIVNSDNLRGVGIFTLNYGGGAPELWCDLRDHFSSGHVPATAAVSATQPATQFSITVSAAQGCGVASFDLQVQDVTVGGPWLDLATNLAPTSNVNQVSSAVVVADTYQGHQYQFRVRTHDARGYVGAWSPPVSTQVPSNATMSHAFKGMYTLDVYG
ncbi:MAG TPA: glycoside hydrolase family 18 protein, partial [Candidatus Dormibacteraeota bacterium]|nr:glycoside hydrolase family 18 protein [Candidatus Dormibacteraeota bacterium]